ncbi:hypothetical protein GH975_03455 [Litorivicinus lipolyticus]|uniref:DUF112 domain-containing protein n=2 Tax=Litorivicinus lipolyticus TaxID=418701 RepID=A0A5Q2Q9Q0_9GAMM|nr:hypothetical protein GH975_03455 [Litorivicinus lipolyticus]
MPGLTATMGCALLISFTFSLPPVQGSLMLMGIFTGGIYGGSISAILIRTPGTPAAAATLLDGHPLLFRDHLEIVCPIFAGMILCQVALLVIGLSGARLFSKLINIDIRVLTPIIFLLCMVGSYSMPFSFFDVGLALGIGVVAYFVGYLLEDLTLQGGVDLSLAKWFDYDGIGRDVRNGLNFVERGFGVRGALGCSDRGHTATSKIKPCDIDWEHIFGELGVRWFHTGGICAALSDDAYEVVSEAMRVAKKHGTVVSYDLNYRPSLWEQRAGLAACQATNRALAEQVDVMMGFPGFLGVQPDGDDNRVLAAADFEGLIADAVASLAEAEALMAGSAGQTQR